MHKHTGCLITELPLKLAMVKQISENFTLVMHDPHLIRLYLCTEKFLEMTRDFFSVGQ